jgi:hypothetical protein
MVSLRHCACGWSNHPAPRHAKYFVCVQAVYARRVHSQPLALALCPVPPPPAPQASIDLLDPAPVHPPMPLLRVVSSLHSSAYPAQGASEGGSAPLPVSARWEVGGKPVPDLRLSGMWGQLCTVVVALENASEMPAGWCAAFW